jgi:hypothetical protein
MHFHHPSPSLEDWRMRCPCGARAEQAYGLCRKCRARANWLRRRARRGWFAHLPKKNPRSTGRTAQEVNA